MHRTKNLRHAGLLILLLTGHTAHAAPKANDGNAAMIKAQGMIRQLNQEKTELQAEKQQWHTETADLEARIQALDSAAARLLVLQAELERYKSALEEVRGNLESQLGQERQNRQALLEKHNTVVAKAKDIHADNELLVKAVQEREQWIAQCSQQNRDLRTNTLEILDRYRDKGFWEQLAELDPVTGIGQVTTETTVEDYTYKLKQLKITPFEAVSGEPAAIAAESPVEPSERAP